MRPGIVPAWPLLLLLLLLPLPPPARAGVPQYLLYQPKLQPSPPPPRQHPSAGGDHALNANLRATTAQRHACKHWQHMACLLDAVEKTCTDDGGVGGGMKELTAFLTPRDTESVWTCCCPRPYRPCARAEADAACVAAMVRRFRPVAAEARAMRRGGGITLPIFHVQRALLAVRGDLWRGGGAACQRYLAKPSATPVVAGAVCGRPAVRRSMRRNDLYCETVTWQWEELGDGDEKEFRANGCPIPRTKMPHVSEGSGAGARKGTLGGFDVPELWPVQPALGLWAACGDARQGLAWAKQQQLGDDAQSLRRKLAAASARSRRVFRAGRRALRVLAEAERHCARRWETRMLALKKSDPLWADAALSTRATFPGAYKAVMAGLRAVGVPTPAAWKWRDECQCVQGT